MKSMKFEKRNDFYYECNQKTFRITISMADKKIWNVTLWINGNIVDDARFIRLPQETIEDAKKKAIRHVAEYVTKELRRIEEEKRKMMSIKKELEEGGVTIWN